MTSRRAFLAALAGAFVADPERLLWRPGAKLISIPKPAPIAMDPRYFVAFSRPLPFSWPGPNLFNPTEDVFKQWERDRAFLLGPWTDEERERRAKLIA